MRCPKCQYIGFDGHTKCRNCGYDLSLTATADVPPPSSSPPASPAADLPLRPEPSAREQARAAIRQHAAGAAPAHAPEAFDLPLFATPGAEERPIGAAPPVARPPLSVRRPAGDTPRPRPAIQQRPQEEPRLELDLQPSEPPNAPASEPEFQPEPASMAVPAAPEEALTADAPPEPAPPTSDVSESESGASLGARLLAGLVDAALLAAIDIAIVASTLRVAGLPMNEVWRLPVGPIAAFLALLAVGYLTMCTVLAGQTAGKVLLGLRVVEVGGRPVRFGPSVVRAVLQVVTVPLLGFGFLPAALTPDRRALYDRLTNTEVVRTRS
jgi:uncharacterized RDD family membrane protein YckC